MRRRAHGRRGFAFRGVTLLALAVAVLFVLGACGEEHPYSTVSPRSENANDIQTLYKVVFWGSLVVFIGVQAGLIYTTLRYRFRPGDPRPPQIHGNKRLEIFWTIIPAVVLLVIFIPTVSTLYEFEEAAEDGPDKLVIEVYGKQWWWEIHYPGLGGPNPDDPNQRGALVTANEIYIPVDQPIQFRMMSNNVIHSFWVPQLTGKVDVIPGHENKLGFTADIPGTYYGECAEFCGESHAYMRFKVLAVPRDQFDAWVAAWNQPPAVDADPATGDVAEAPRSFAACIACHRVNGTNASAAGVGIDAVDTAGPNLTLFGCRTTIAAGLLENTPENLHAWIADAPSIKQGSMMPQYGADPETNPRGLTDEQIAEIVTYLEGLVPPGGCPPVSTENLNE